MKNTLKNYHNHISQQNLKENWTIYLVMVSDILAWLNLYYIILYIKLKEINSTYLSFDIKSIELDLTDRKVYFTSHISYYKKR